MRRDKILVAAGGLAVLGLAVAAVLAGSQSRVLAAGPPARQAVASTGNGELAACQANEAIARGTTALRLSLSAFVGPPVTVRVYSDGRTIAVGRHGSGWSGSDVTVALKAMPRPISNATVCFATSPIDDELIVYGRRTGASEAARVSHDAFLTGRVKIEDLGDGNASWLSLAGSIAQHIGQGRAWSGTWVAFLIGFLMLGASGLAFFIYLREPDE